MPCVRLLEELAPFERELLLEQRMQHDGRRAGVFHALDVVDVLGNGGDADGTSGVRSFSPRYVVLRSM